MSAQKKYKDFETAVERLEEITDQLESGNQKLDDAIKSYTEGLEIAKFCDDKLGEAKKKIKLIAQKNGLPIEVEFDDNGVEE